MFTPIRRAVFAATLAALPLCALTAPVSAQTNLLTVNPSFDAQFFSGGNGLHTISGWNLEYYAFGSFGTINSQSGSSDNENQATNGTRLFSLDRGGRVTTAPTARANVTPGRVYRFDFDARAYDEAPGQWRGTVPYIQFFDAGGNLVKQVTGMDAVNPVQNGLAQQISWRTYSMTATTPPNAVKAGVQIVASRGSFPNDNNRYTRIDNMRLFEAGETRNRITVRNAPKLLRPGTNATATLAYNATQNSNVFVRLLRGNIIVGQTQRAVTTGRGTVDVAIPVPANAPVAANYSWDVRLQPTGTTTITARQTVPGAFVDTVPTGSNIINHDNPLLTYGGRWFRPTPTSAPEGYWAQTQVQARFTGTSITLRAEKSQFETMSLVVIFDNDESTLRRVSLPSGNQAIVLANNLSDGEHTVTVMQNSESNSGWWRFYGFTLGAGKSLLKPEPLGTRRIEIYGDSITSGGTPDPIVPEPNPNNDGDYTGNVYRTFGAYTARAFGADYRSISKGGSGVAGGFVSYTMLQYYDKWNFDGYTPANAQTWDFARWTPDVVVIGVGHNDQFGSNANWVPNYQTLVTNLRQKYPNAHIFCVNTSMTNNAGHFKRAWLPLAPDPKLYYKLVRPGHGHGGHPRLNDHREMATGNVYWEGLVEWIGDTMGW